MTSRSPACLLTIVGALTVVLTTAIAANAGADDHFRSSSANIGCAGTEAFVRCDVRSGLKPKPLADSTCQLDWGQGIEMSDTGSPTVVCAGDTAFNGSARIVPAGSAWRRGKSRCAFGVSTVRCTNRSGHGFFISNRQWFRF